MMLHHLFSVPSIVRTLIYSLKLVNKLKGKKLPEPQSFWKHWKANSSMWRSIQGWRTEKDIYFSRKHIFQLREGCVKVTDLQNTQER